MNCKKPDCNKCSQKARYCGINLECLSVEKGETYDSIIKKINDLLCRGEQGVTYTFEDNELCDNGGIRIFENLGEEIELIYETCFPCCSSDPEVKGFYVYTQGCDLFLGGSEWVTLPIPSTCQDVITFPITAPVDGDYLVTLELFHNTEGEDFLPAEIGVGINNTEPVGDTYTNPYHISTYNTGTNAGGSSMHMFRLNGLESLDEITVWFRGNTISFFTLKAKIEKI